MNTRPSPHPGIVIAFEGLEGAGKSTIAHRLIAALNEDSSHGYNEAEYVSEWQTELGKKAKAALRFEGADGVAFDPTPNHAMSEALMVLAAKSEFIARVLRPGVAAGKILICDRYTGTFLAYQGGLRGLGQEFLVSLMRQTNTLVLPNLELYFDVSDEARRARRGTPRDHMEAAVDAGVTELRGHYDATPSYLPRYQRVIIDASADVDTVFDQVLTVVRQRLKLHRITGASINVDEPTSSPERDLLNQHQQDFLNVWTQASRDAVTEPSTAVGEMIRSVADAWPELDQFQQAILDSAKDEAPSVFVGTPGKLQEHLSTDVPAAPKTLEINGVAVTAVIDVTHTEATTIVRGARSV